MLDGPIISFLRDGILLEDNFEACRLWYRSARYFLDKGKLFKKGFSAPSLLCLDKDWGKYTLEEVHTGVYGNHSSGKALAHRILRQGHYWPTIQADSLDFVQKCDKCQHFQPSHTSLRKIWPQSSVLSHLQNGELTSSDPSPQLGDISSTLWSP